MAAASLPSWAISTPSMRVRAGLPGGPASTATLAAATPSCQYTKSSVEHELVGLLPGDLHEAARAAHRNRHVVGRFEDGDVVEPHPDAQSRSASMPPFSVHFFSIAGTAFSTSWPSPSSKVRYESLLSAVPANEYK